MARIWILLALLTAAPAQAAGEVGVQRVAVVRLDFEGAVPEAGRDLFAQRLVDGLQVARFEVLMGAELDMRLKARGQAACTQPACYPDLARTVGVGYLVGGRVAEQGKTYNIDLELFNGRTGASIAQVHERCETCGIDEAGEKMNLAASALRTRLEALAQAPARFTIRSTPPAAYASIDGKDVGRTPIDLELAAGEHRLTLEHNGYEPAQRTFMVVSGVDEGLDVNLLEQPSLFPYRTIGWAAMAAGLLAAAGGAYAVAIDGKEISCSAGDKDAAGRCPYVNKTAVLGAVLIGFGAASASVGGVMLYLGSRHDEGGRRAFGVGWRGRF